MFTRPGNSDPCSGFRVGSAPLVSPFVLGDTDEEGGRALEVPPLISMVTPIKVTSQPQSMKIAIWGDIFLEVQFLILVGVVSELCFTATSISSGIGNFHVFFSPSIEAVPCLKL